MCREAHDLTKAIECSIRPIGRILLFCSSCPYWLIKMKTPSHPNNDVYIHKSFLNENVRKLFALRKIKLYHHDARNQIYLRYVLNVFFVDKFILFVGAFVQKFKCS